MSIDVNMSGIEEKPPLATPGPYVLSHRKVELRRNKADDADLIYTELVVDGQPDESFIQRWSFKTGALTARSNAISLKQFLETVGRNDLANMHITPDTVAELIQGIREIKFSATVKHELYNGEVQIRLDTVLEAV